MWEFKFNEQSEKSLSRVQLCDPMDCSLPGSSAHGILQTRILEWVAVLFSRESSQPRDQPSSPALQADFLPSEPLGNPKNTGVDGLSHLQGIFQESNQRLLHCRWVLCQLSYQGSPGKWVKVEKENSQLNKNGIQRVVWSYTRPPDLPIEKPICRSERNS